MPRHKIALNEYCTRNNINKKNLHRIEKNIERYAMSILDNILDGRYRVSENNGPHKHLVSIYVFDFILVILNKEYIVIDSFTFDIPYDKRECYQNIYNSSIEQQTQIAV